MKPLNLKWEGLRPCPRCGNVVAMFSSDGKVVEATCGCAVPYAEWKASWKGCWWAMQISVKVRGGSKWEFVRMTGVPPYRYPTKAQANQMLETSYPDQCRLDRLEGKRSRARVVPVLAPGVV